MQGQFLPSQEGLGSITTVNQDPGAEACRWNVGADFPEPSFKVDLNWQSCYTSESNLPGTLSGWGVPGWVALLGHCHMTSIAWASVPGWSVPSDLMAASRAQRQDDSFGPKL